jgi:hypothetical protein
MEKRMSDQKNAVPKWQVWKTQKGSSIHASLELDGFEVTLYRNQEGIMTVAIYTEDSVGDDVFVEHAIPRLEVILNEERRWTNPDGTWSGE